MRVKGANSMMSLRLELQVPIYKAEIFSTVYVDIITKAALSFHKWLDKGQLFTDVTDKAKAFWMYFEVVMGRGIGPVMEHHAYTVFLTLRLDLDAVYNTSCCNVCGLSMCV